MGYLNNGFCHADITAAVSAAVPVQAVDSGVAAVDYTAPLAPVQDSPSLWSVQVPIAVYNGANLVQSYQRTLYFSDCDATVMTNDDVASLSWLVVGALAAAWAINRLREAL